MMAGWRIGAVMLAAAMLEVGGDAAVRLGLRSGGIVTRTVLFATGAGVLLGYGVLVNGTGTGFGRALGVYAAVFLLLAQVADWVVFGGRPGWRILVGGTLVMLGGVVMATGR